MNLLLTPSPNFRERHPGVRVDTVLLHHTGARDSGRGALAWLCNPASKVSAHYLVAKDGAVFSLVPEEKASWHAGLGRLPWETCEPYDFNQRSLGVEVANAGDGQDSFTEAQYAALAELVPAIAERLNGSALVRPDAERMHRTLSTGVSLPGLVFVMGHRDVATPPGRKTDPADNFDWGRVRAALAGGNHVA